MSPIRPTNQLPVAQPRPVRPETRAAQRAFFQAAVAPTATARPAASSEPVRAAAATARVTGESTEQPQRYLRPGSLVDIKV